MPANLLQRYSIYKNLLRSMIKREYNKYYKTAYSYSNCCKYKAYIITFYFSKSIDDYINKHNLYTSFII